MSSASRSTEPAGQSDTLLVGLRGGTLLITGDAGKSWSRLALQLPDVAGLAAAPA